MGRDAMKPNRLILALLAALWPLPLPADQIGIVLMHGKQSQPGEHTSLATAIRAAGFATDVPEMCWSFRRIYDRPYADCLREIDDAISRLKQKGATAFVVAGHSLGANGALAYGATHQGLKGIIALAPGHRPDALGRRAEVAASLKGARDLVAAGRGGLPVSHFFDFNGDFQVRLFTTSNIYLSFLAPDSLAVMPNNAARLSAPLLYVVGTADPLQSGPDEIFAKAPPHPLNRYVTIRAGHFDTSAASAPAVVTWLKEIAKTKSPAIPAGSVRPPPR
jgi:pimeloyl-ACP methyl ester carboxylesterase